MTPISMLMWDQQSTAQQQLVEAVFGAVNEWLQLPRMRESNLAVAWQHGQPVALSIMCHDRVRVGSALVDVATVRHTHFTNDTNDVLVELIMYQAQSFLEEGIGIVMIKGDIAYWSQYGFAPISMDVETRWTTPPTLRADEPGRVRIGVLTPAECELVRGIQMGSADTQCVEYVDFAQPTALPWVKLVGRDGQLHAAAQCTAHVNSVVVRRAVASDDGAAYDLVSALLNYAASRELVIQLPQAHALTRMAQEHRAITRVSTSRAHSLMAGVIDLPTMLHALTPAFRQRIAASQYATWNGGVRVEIRDERAMIMVKDTTVTIIDGTREASVRLKHVEVPALAQMAFGYRSIGALRKMGMLYCDDTELPLCEVLFPGLASTLDV